MALRDERGRCRRSWASTCMVAGGRPALSNGHSALSLLGTEAAHLQNLPLPVGPPPTPQAPSPQPQLRPRSQGSTPPPAGPPSRDPGGPGKDIAPPAPVWRPQSLGPKGQETLPNSALSPRRHREGRGGEGPGHARPDRRHRRSWWGLAAAAALPSPPGHTVLGAPHPPDHLPEPHTAGRASPQPRAGAREEAGPGEALRWAGQGRGLRLLCTRPRPTGHREARVPVCPGVRHHPAGHTGEQGRKWWYCGGVGPCGQLCWGLGRRRHPRLGPRPPRPTAGTSSPRTSLGQSQFHPRAALPGQASAPACPSPTAHRVGPRDWQRAEEGKGTPALAPWDTPGQATASRVPGVVDVRAADGRIPQASALNTATGRGPANVCPRPVRSPRGRSTDQASCSQGNSTPRAALPGPCQHEAHPAPAPGPGPLWLNPQAKGTWAQQRDVCPGL